MNLFPSESLDSMDAFPNSSAYHQSHESLGFFSPIGNVKGFARNPCIDVDGNFNLEMGLDTLGNTLDCKKNSESDVAANVFSYSMDVFQEGFDELVYPKGDPDAVSLCKKDVDLLQPDTCINDTIIDFYIQYLKNKIQEKEKARFHFFNSFFFRKLADMDKNPPNACDGKSAFLRVHKWTRKVNLFEKDYIFVPVNFNHHWSLLVICYPGELVNINDKEPEKLLRLPCILHMDSIMGHHSGLKDLVQSYLCEEWKERNKDTYGEDLSSRFLNMRFIPVAVPQQQNSFDCGLFLLHYLELFLAESPFNFNPLIPNKFSKFLKLDWFPPVDPYFKRPLIRRLIFNLVENHGAHEGFSPDNGDDHHCSDYNDKKIGDQCHLINGEASTSHVGQGIEMAPSFDTSSMVLKENFEPGTALGFSVRYCQSFDQRPSNHCFNGSMFTVEDTDLSAHLQAEHVNSKSSLDTSSCASDNSDVEMIENPPVKKKSRSYWMSVENLRHLQDVNDSAATINFPVKKESKSYWMSIENLRHLQDVNDSAATINFPVKKESKSYWMSVENIRYLQDVNDSAATINFPVKKESKSYWMSVENIRYLQDMNDSAATVNLPDLNDVVDNNVINDDVQIINNMNLDLWNERPAKKMRLMTPWAEVMES